MINIGDRFKDNLIVTNSGLKQIPLCQVKLLTQTHRQRNPKMLINPDNQHN